MTSWHLTKLVLWDSILFARGHTVSRWAVGLGRTVAAAAIAEAPINKRAHKSFGEPPVGSLKAGVHGSAFRAGPKRIQMDISSDAHYSLAVLKGTGPIYPHGPVLKLPINAGHGRRTRFYTVSGQSANNFLGRAVGIAAARHSSLRGFEHRV